MALTPAPLPGLGPAREWKTSPIVPVAEGGRLAEFDEYRCFPLDSSLEKEAFITGYDVIPGTPSLVHQVVAALPSRGDSEYEVAFRSRPDRADMLPFSVNAPQSLAWALSTPGVYVVGGVGAGDRIGGTYSTLMNFW